LRTVAGVLLALGLAAAAPALAATSSSPSSTPSFRPMDPAVQLRLDEASARIETLSRALRAAIGDPEEYARLRAEHEAAVLTYEAIRKVAYP